MFGQSMHAYLKLKASKALRERIQCIDCEQEGTSKITDGVYIYKYLFMLSSHRVGFHYQASTQCINCVIESIMFKHRNDIISPSFNEIANTLKKVKNENVANIILENI